MKYRLFLTGLMAAVVAWLGVLTGQCSAGLITTAFGAWNDDNDKLTDYSWAVKPDSTDPDYPDIPDIVVGLARIDRIQTDGHGEFDFTVSKKIWLAFAFEAARGSVGSNDPYGSTFLGWIKHQAPSDSSYQLSTLLGNNLIPATAMFVLLELNSSPGSGSNLYKFEDQKYASEVGASVMGAFSEIGTIGFSWVAAFGITDSTKDFLYLSTSASVKQEVFGLGLVGSGPGVNAADFKPLFPVIDTYGIDETKYVFASMDVVSVYTNPGNPNEFKDSGVAVVNYVPEPTSIAALVGLAGTALSGYALRRRKA